MTRTLAAISTPLVRSKEVIGLLRMLPFAVSRKTVRFTVIGKNDNN
jgi:hypothetical protein